MKCLRQRRLSLEGCCILAEHSFKSRRPALQGNTGGEGWLWDASGANVEDLIVYG